MADETEVVEIRSDGDVVTARQRARALASQLGLTSTDLTLLATAISEVARNITTYAGEGEIRLRLIERRGRRGLEVVAHDEGPGIANLDKALQDGYTTGRGMGLGLPGARRLMDEFEVETEVGRGTTITMAMWGKA